MNGTGSGTPTKGSMTTWTRLPCSATTGKTSNGRGDV